MTKILIADDSNLMRNVLKDILAQNGFQDVILAKNGLEAVRLYKEHKPDVVTMDVTMPKLSGLDAAKEIKAFDNDAKIIMCSAMGQSYHVGEAMAVGVNDYIVKPFTPEKVIQSIKKALS